MTSKEVANSLSLVGIDVGGTFTDFVWRVNGDLHVLKVPTTPDNQSRAIEHGLEELGVGTGVQVIHGTTVATNALLERRGARAALVTTRGFADVLAIGRQNRPSLYGLSQARRPVLIPAEWRFEVNERVDVRGAVITPLDEAEVDVLAQKLDEEKIESLAIVLLFSYLNPAHERLVAQRLASLLPQLNVSVSSELLPEYREYERTSTLSINAYVQPLVAAYLSRLDKSLKGRSIFVMQSNGGVLSLDGASKQAGRLVLSGPAGGVVGAFEVAKKGLNTSTPEIITFDMGGTSTDVALSPGVLPRTTEGEITAIPIRFPSMNIHTVGAGGGSIARVDAGGVLRVGPESAGARPGPVCYGRGGTQPTVTDANLVLGRIPKDGFQGGGMQLDEQAAFDALSALGKLLGLNAHEAALGVIRVANAVMERALRRISIEQGYDPREYTLLPFGGAGALHACELAEALGIHQILIPRYPGVLSAWGLTIADNTFDASTALLLDSEAVLENPDVLEKNWQVLEKKVREGLPVRAGEPSFHAWFDLRYRGQSFELEIPVELPLGPAALKQAIDSFHSVHERRFGYRLSANSVEVVALRVQGSHPGTAMQEPGQGPDRQHSQDVQQCSVWFEKAGPVRVPFVQRDDVKEENSFMGPAVIGQYDATLLVFPTWRVSADIHRNILLRRT